MKIVNDYGPCPKVFSQSLHVFHLSRTTRDKYLLNAAQVIPEPATLPACHRLRRDRRSAVERNMLQKSTGNGTHAEFDGDCVNRFRCGQGGSLQRFIQGLGKHTPTSHF